MDGLLHYRTSRVGRPPQGLRRVFEELRRHLERQVPGQEILIDRMLLALLADGHLLVDGGLVGNLPVDIVRDMGVDVVIAVDVEFPLYTLEELQSAITVSEQMLTILIRKEI